MPESQFSVLKVETVQMNHKSNAGTLQGHLTLRLHRAKIIDASVAGKQLL